MKIIREGMLEVVVQENRLPDATVWARPSKTVRSTTVSLNVHYRKDRVNNTLPNLVYEAKDIPKNHHSLRNLFRRSRW